MKALVKRLSNKISKLSPDQVQNVFTQLVEENDSLLSVIESLSTGLVICDKNWKLLQSNKAGERFLPLTSRYYELKHQDSSFDDEVWNFVDDEEIANLVAENFVADFYTLKNKAGSEDIGGLTYLPEANRADFVTYASVYAYGNYESIKQKYGTKHLPQVKEVEVTSSVSQDATYAGNVYDGFVVTVALTFEKTKATDLPASIDVTVIDLDGTYRVIAAE